MNPLTTLIELLVALASINLATSALLFSLMPLPIWRRRAPQRLPQAARPSGGLPRVSIIVPVRSEPRWVVEGLLESLRTVEYPRDRLEFILAVEEDGLGDAEALLGGLAGLFRVRVAVNRGVKTKSSALAEALKVAQGDVIGVYDADDRPDRLQVLIAVGLLGSGYDVVQFPKIAGGPRCGLASHASWTESVAYYSRIAYFIEALMGVPLLGGSSYYISRRALDRAGGYIPGEQADDISLTVRLSAVGARGTVYPGSPSATLHPEGLAGLVIQRSRWLRGALESCRHAFGSWRSFSYIPLALSALTPIAGITLLAHAVVAESKASGLILLASLTALAASYGSMGWRSSGGLRGVASMAALLIAYTIASLIACADIITRRRVWRRARRPSRSCESPATPF